MNNHYSGTAGFMKMIVHGIEVISNLEAAVESLATKVGCSSKKPTSYHDANKLTYFVLCVVFIRLFAIEISQRRGVAVALEGRTATCPPFIARLRAVYDLLSLMPAAPSIGPQHTTHTDHSTPRQSVEVSHNTNGVAELTQGDGSAGCERISQ
jgi:hypothetical protein